MTYNEYLGAVLGKFGLSATEIDFILIEADLTPSAVITGPEDKVKLKTAVYQQIPLMIAGLSDVSEGGYSVKWNIDGIKLWYATLAAELDLEDQLTPKAVIRDKSNRW